MFKNKDISNGLIKLDKFMTNLWKKNKVLTFIGEYSFVLWVLFMIFISILIVTIEEML